MIDDYKDLTDDQLKDLQKKLDLNNQKGIYKVFHKLPEIKSLEELMSFDKKFFDDNPETEAYIRPFTKYDLQDCPVKIHSKVTYVLVRQLLKGVRVRAYIENLDIFLLN